MLWKKVVFYLKQETAVASKRREDGPRYHIINKQPSLKMDSARDSDATSNPDCFILDMTGSSDNKFEVRNSFLFLCYVSTIHKCSES